MSDSREAEELEKEKEERFRRELSAKMARMIQQRLPGLPVPLEMIQRHVYSNLTSEMFEYDLTQRSPDKELAEIRESIASSVLGILTHFGENIEDLVSDERKRRRVVNAAIEAAADAEYDFIEMMREGADWDITKSIRRRTDKIVRRHTIQYQVFIYNSIAGVAILAALTAFSVISWIWALIIAVAWIVGLRAGTRFLDVHNH
jgi:hypothetical protein